MRKQHDLVKKIYICRDYQKEQIIISKVLIELMDGSFSYVELPSSYGKMTSDKQQVKRDNFLENLNYNIQLLFSQSKDNKNLDNIEIIFVQHDDLELCRFVEEKVKTIDTEKDELYDMTFGTSFSFISLLSLFITNASVISIPMVSLSSLLSCFNFYEAIRSNQELKFLEVSNNILRRIKLSFSCLMLTISVGLNVSNFCINFDSFQSSIKLSRYLKVVKKQEKILNDLENPFSDNKALVTTYDAQVNILMEAFGCNPLINEKDLKIALSLEKYLEDNPYLDMESLYETFASVGIIKFVNDNGNVSGDYARELNVIGIYDCLDKEQEEYTQTLQHELVHATGNLDNYMLNEGMTTLICAEYFSDFKVTNAYCEHVLMTKIFCELVTPEKMLEAYSKNDMTIIKEEMLKNNPNEEDYKKLILAMQKYGKDFNDADNLNEFVLDNNETIYQIIELLVPYLKSDCVSKETKFEILYYMEHLGQWEDVNHKVYFNESASTDNLIKSVKKSKNN